ncbi:MAG TPA: dihydrofolate reductase family protein [Acidimicrobiales bacterium]|nr:dihydrofolate reductase family protein [Acidimicrobiales bacterium]
MAAKLLYSAFTSLDGYVADENGNFEWAELDEEVLAFINNRERRVGTYLFGRKVYETMSVWETPEVIPNPNVAMMEYVPIWQATEKVVYSTTLRTVSTARTRLERTFDADAVRELKAGATRDLAVGGPALAAQAIRAGLVDEYHLLVAPIIAGGGNPYLPGQVRVKLELLDERRFDHGLVYLQYRAKS